MAATKKNVTKNNRSTSSTRKKTTSTSTGRKNNTTSKATRKQAENKTPRQTTGARKAKNASIINKSDGLSQEVVFSLVLIAMVVVFLCNIGVIKEALGIAIKGFMLGTFGFLGYLMPIIILFWTWYFIVNAENKKPVIKIGAAFTLLFFFGAFLGLVSKNNITNLLGDEHYIQSLYDFKSGGGVIFGLLALGIVKLLGKLGGCIITLIIIGFCIVILSGKSLVHFIEKFIYHNNYEDDEEDYEDYEEYEYEEDEYGQKYLSKKEAAALLEDKKDKEDKVKGKKSKRINDFDMTAFSSRDTGIDNIDETAKEDVSDVNDNYIEEDDKELPAVIEPEETGVVVTGNNKNKSSNIDNLKNEAKDIKDFFSKKKSDADNLRREKEQKRKDMLDRKDDERILQASKNIINEEDFSHNDINKDDVHFINIVPEISGDNNNVSPKSKGVDPSIYKVDNKNIEKTHRDIEEIIFEESTPVADNSSANNKDDIKKVKDVVITRHFDEPVVSKDEKVENVTNNQNKSNAADIAVSRQTDAQVNITEDEDVRFDTSPIHIPDELIVSNSSKDNETAVNKTSVKASSEVNKPVNKNSSESVNVPKPNDTPMEIDTGYVSIKPYDTLDDLKKMPDPITEKTHEKQNQNTAEPAEKKQVRKIIHKRSDYKAPHKNLLTLNEKKHAGDSDDTLKETALKLQTTLETFGVKAEVSHISQGPSVTRYELTLGAGIKVNKILGLTDDIKLSLAALDIRIEAPIPGKSAIGIEIPNKETSPVLIRDIIESSEFKKADSRLSFGVGKDITGKTIVADIAKMPHMLIAGSTGSGKSVCINTLIMSILYNAHPDDVKLIMIDPKVVELSVYNGIPHLMIPVVTDPKKASAALKWAVNEMTNRYNAFAAFNVRDLKGYNEKAAQMQKESPEDAPDVLPQIVVIVDELADLMMVASKEVEESICRLAQLARAAGIHLIIATQRPSVDVITGLIKANMPSRVAFRVSSGVDSRTILDMIGAERLLGKGDMLFYPQGYTKPLRVQGAFVSDKEVSDVVDYLIKNNEGYYTDSDIDSQITGLQSGNDNNASSSGDNNSQETSGVDEYFKDACKAVVKKGSASSGYLQRMYRIGFNRAARIVDQMEEYGIVGPEQGTKPRQVLVSEIELESILANIK